MKDLKLTAMWSRGLLAVTATTADGQKSASVECPVEEVWQTIIALERAYQIPVELAGILILGWEKE